jgi:hypothetical protein
MTDACELPTDEHPILAWQDASGPAPDLGFIALAAAIRRDKQVAHRPDVPARPCDHALYGRLRSLEEPS